MSFTRILSLRISRAVTFNGFSTGNSSQCLSVASSLLCKVDEGSAADSENKIRDSLKDRSQVIPVDTSIKYLQSSAYKTTYGDDPVWKHYRRNFKGQFAPRKTRRRCIRNNLISTGNPCPICRDEYLVLHEKNIDLLKQFISPFTGQVLDAFDTGVCQRKQQELLVAVERARDSGAITYDVPFRNYDYTEYGVKVDNNISEK